MERQLIQYLVEGALFAARPVMNSPLLNEGLRRPVINTFMELLSRPARGVEVIDSQVGGVRCLEMSENAAAERCILYLHGGGYNWGSPEGHAGLVSSLVRRTGFNAVVPDYRLAPEHPFPAALDDALAVYLEVIDRYGAQNVVIGGDSAGGGLTLSLMMKLRDDGHDLPAAGFCLSPWTDLTCSGDSFQSRARQDPMLSLEMTRRWAGYYADGKYKNALVSPLYGDFSGLPPILVHVGEREILLDDSRRLLDRVSKTDCELMLKVWSNMIHVFQYFEPFVTEAALSLEEIARFCHSSTRREVEAPAFS